MSNSLISLLERLRTHHFDASKFEQSGLYRALCDAQANLKIAELSSPTETLGQSLSVLSIGLSFALCNHDHAGTRRDVAKAQARLEEVKRFVSALEAKASALEAKGDGWEALDLVRKQLALRVADCEAGGSLERGLLLAIKHIDAMLTAAPDQARLNASHAGTLRQSIHEANSPHGHAALALEGPAVLIGTGATIARPENPAVVMTGANNWPSGVVPDAWKHSAITDAERAAVFFYTGARVINCSTAQREQYRLMFPDGSRQLGAYQSQQEAVDAFILANRPAQHGE